MLCHTYPTPNKAAMAREHGARRSVAGNCRLDVRAEQRRPIIGGAGTFAWWTPFRQARRQRSVKAQELAHDLGPPRKPRLVRQRIHDDGSSPRRRRLPRVRLQQAALFSAHIAAAATGCGTGFVTDKEDSRSEE